MCSYVEKYAKFINQTLKKTAGTQKCYAQWNTPGVGNFPISTEMGYPIPQHLISPTLRPKENFCIWCQIVFWDPMNEKKMFLKNKHIWAMRNCMVTMAILNAILTGRGLHTNSIIS